jgi:hypothetical protein
MDVKFHSLQIILFCEVKNLPFKTFFKTKIVDLNKVSILCNILIYMVSYISEMWKVFVGCM